MTWYPQNYVANLPMTDMAMRADPARGYPGRTYRFYKGPVVFPFGLGLSYTRFSHSLAQGPTLVSVSFTSLVASKNTTMPGNHDIRVSHTNCDSLSLDVHIDIKNSGTMDGTHTLLVFATPPTGKWAPNKQLVGFHKVHIVAGSERRVRVGVQVCKHLSVVDELGIRRIPLGQHKLEIGDLQHHVSVEANLGEIKF